MAARSRGASEGARRGALAVVIRSIGTDRNRLPHTGGMRYAEDLPRIPAAALSIPDADLLAAQLAGGQPVRLRLRLTARLLGEAESANVIDQPVAAFAAFAYLAAEAPGGFGRLPVEPEAEPRR